MVAELGRRARGDDLDARRAEFLAMVDAARNIAPTWPPREGPALPPPWSDR
jgi:hypothetical protein